MAGLTPDTPTPEALTVHGASRVLEVAYSDGASFRIPFELLRVYSPSAEVQGHGPGQEVLQTGKRDVAITAIEPVGNYAIKPFFSDGHESGLYTCTNWAAARTSSGRSTWTGYRSPAWTATRPCPARPAAAGTAAAATDAVRTQGQGRGVCRAVPTAPHSGPLHSTGLLGVVLY
jgi:DUF971 family protein